MGIRLIDKCDEFFDRLIPPESMFDKDIKTLTKNAIRSQLSNTKQQILKARQITGDAEINTPKYFFSL